MHASDAWLGGSINQVCDGKHLDDVPEDQVCHHGVADEDHAGHDEEVDEVGACQPQRARDDAQTGLEVHQPQDARDEQQDVDAVEGKVPSGGRGGRGGAMTLGGRTAERPGPLFSQKAVCSASSGSA